MNKNIEFNTFINDSLSLARTMVIKCEQIAIIDNNLMKRHGYQITNDKKSWRYYLNLNGEYHFTDEKMYVKSLDNDETILFSKENLEDHLTTKRAYRLGSYYFTRLLDSYPSQDVLIKGIINPIPYEESIEAKDYQILRYNKDYVLWNEHQLIFELQDFIYKEVQRAFNTEYLYTDNLMLPLLLENLHVDVFKFILSNRYEHRRTRHAHSFFIWSHLTSLGLSPIYKNVLNRKQVMYFFRNLEYILRNAGKEKTLHELIDIVLTERNIPLSAFDMELTTGEMLENIAPEPVYISTNLNLHERMGIGRKLHTISSVTKKEEPDTIDNPRNYDAYNKSTYFESKYSIANSIPIKVLESELVDVTNRHQDTIFTILTNHWLYLSYNNLYNINLDVVDNKTGNHLRLTTKEAFVLWIHLLNKWKGNDCKNIPQYYFTRANRVVTPSIQKLMSLGHQDVLTKEWVTDLLKTKVSYSRIISPEAFLLKCKEINANLWKQTKMYSAQLDITYLSRRKHAVESLYETGFVKITDFKTYDDFLNSIEFSLKDYTQIECLELAFEVWKTAVGWDTMPYMTLAQEQNYLISLMKYLSSYTVQYVNNVFEEEGWYEAGVSLHTGNGVLMGAPDTSELSAIKESNVLHNSYRVVMDNESVLVTEGNVEADRIEVKAQSIKEGLIKSSLNIYGSGFDNEDKYGSYVINSSMKLVELEVIEEEADILPEGIVANTFEFKMDEGFPTTAFKGAFFNILLPNPEAYTWSSDSESVMVDNTGRVEFISKPPVNVTITIKNPKGKKEYKYKINVSLWFTLSKHQRSDVVNFKFAEDYANIVKERLPEMAEVAKLDSKRELIKKPNIGQLFNEWNIHRLNNVNPYPNSDLYSDGRNSYWTSTTSSWGNDGFNRYVLRCKVPAVSSYSPNETLGMNTMTVVEVKEEPVEIKPTGLLVNGHTFNRESDIKLFPKKGFAGAQLDILMDKPANQYTWTSSNPTAISVVDGKVTMLSRPTDAVKITIKEKEGNGLGVFDIDLIYWFIFSEEKKDYSGSITEGSLATLDQLINYIRNGWGPITQRISLGGLYNEWGDFTVFLDGKYKNNYFRTGTTDGTNNRKSFNPSSTNTTSMISNVSNGAISFNVYKK